MKPLNRNMPEDVQADYDAVAAWMERASKTKSDAELAAIEHLRPAEEVFERLDAYYDQAIVKEVKRYKKIKRAIRH